MKKKLLLTLLMSICLTSVSFFTKAQTTVTVDGSGTWVGYMNVFDLSMNYQFGSLWGLTDVKSTINPGFNSVTLQPNFNTYQDNPGNPYWTNGPIGNKIMEANTFLESTGLSGQTVTFTGNVLSNNLDVGYTRSAFVKALDPAMSYATVVNQTVALPASGSFSVSAVIPATPGLIVQYGFTITGLNANPLAETALGSLTVGPVVPTPLQLTNFTATLVQGRVNINWETEDEKFVKEFEVQKGFDGVDFETFDKVKANNNKENSYSTTDYSNVNESYYRLKMVDIDGSFTYSEVIKIIRTNQQSNILYPNPANDKITIIANGNNNEPILVTNTSGLVIDIIKTNIKNIELDISSFATGVYFVKFQNGQTKQFIKK